MSRSRKGVSCLCSPYGNSSHLGIPFGNPQRRYQRRRKDAVKSSIQLCSIIWSSLSCKLALTYKLWLEIVPVIKELPKDFGVLNHLVIMRHICKHLILGIRLSKVHSATLSTKKSIFKITHNYPTSDCVSYSRKVLVKPKVYILKESCAMRPKSTLIWTGANKNIFCSECVQFIINHMSLLALCSMSLHLPKNVQGFVAELTPQES